VPASDEQLSVGRSVRLVFAEQCVDPKRLTR
jgi:hypothetical protein